MTDESCGCKCRDCKEQDIHACGRDACGYNYREMYEEIYGPEPGPQRDPDP